MHIVMKKFKKMSWKKGLDFQTLHQIKYTYLLIPFSHKVSEVILYVDFYINLVAIDIFSFLVNCKFIFFVYWFIFYFTLRNLHILMNLANSTFSICHLSLIFSIHVEILGCFCGQRNFFFIFCTSDLVRPSPLWIHI